MKVNTRNQLIFLIFLSAFFIRWGFVVFYPGGKMLSQEVLCDDGYKYDQWAMNILNHGCLQLSIKDALGELFPSPFPLYSIFLSVVYFIFGHNLVILRLVQAALGALTCIVVYFLAKEVSEDETVSLISAIIMALHYPSVTAVGYVMTESLFTLILVCAALLLIRAVKSPRSFLYWLCGLCWGLAALCRPVIWGFAPVLAVYVSYVLLRHKAGFIKYFFLFILGISLALVPWSARNYKVYGIFTPAFGGGFGLYLGNSPLATGGSGGWDSPQDVRVEKDIEQRYHKLSPLELDSLFRRRAVEFVINNPRRVIILAMKKFINMWRPYYDTARPANRIIYVATDLLFIFPYSIAGMVICRRKRIYTLFYLLVGYYIFIHMILVSLLRFRLPLMPFLAIFAACILKKIFERIGLEKAAGLKTRHNYR